MFRKGKSSRYINYFSSSYHYQGTTLTINNDNSFKNKFIYSLSTSQTLKLSNFFLDSDKLKSHKENLQTAIRTNSTICDRQLYIFDEARRFPPKLLDSLGRFSTGKLFCSQYVNFLECLKATFLDPGSPHSKPLRRSIFLFLYEGDEPVVDWALEMWQKRQHREDLSLRLGFILGCKSIYC